MSAGALRRIAMTERDDRTDGQDLRADQRADDRAKVRGGRLVGALYTLMGALALGVLAGWALDRHFESQPKWTVGLSMLGLVVGFYHLVRETMR